MSKLDALLGDDDTKGEDSLIVEKRSPISQAYITRSALNKAYAYARIACEVVEESAECYGYLISPRKCEDRIVRDVCFAPNQKVSGADVVIGGNDVIKIGRELDKKEYKILGWWHSHADFDTFHSGTDDGNMMTILNCIGPTNYVTINREMSLMQGKLRIRRRGANVEIYDSDNPSKVFRLNIGTKEFNAKDLGIIKNITANLPIRIGFAYSVVVNAKGDKPYCEIATEDFCGLCHEGDKRSIESKLRVVNIDKFKFNEAEMLKEVKKKIKKPRSYVSVVKGVGKAIGGRIKEFFGEDETEDINEVSNLQKNHWYGPKPCAHKGKLIKDRELIESDGGGLEKAIKIIEGDQTEHGSGNE